MSNTKENQTLQEKIKKEENNQIQLQEGLSWAGKLFFASLAAYIGGSVASKMMPIKLKGTPEQVRAVVDAVIASKAFQDEIKKPGATIESVIQKLNLKNMNKQRFERLTNHKWPL